MHRKQKIEGRRVCRTMFQITLQLHNGRCRPKPNASLSPRPVSGRDLRRRFSALSFASNTTNSAASFAKRTSRGSESRLDDTGFQDCCRFGRARRSNDCSYELFAAPGLKPIAPVLEIAFVRLRWREVNDIGKAHCPELHLEIFCAEHGQPRLANLCTPLCRHDKGLSFQARQRLERKDEAENNLARP